jgi:hypothetical protein
LAPLTKRDIWSLIKWLIGVPAFVEVARLYEHWAPLLWSLIQGLGFPSGESAFWGYLGLVLLVVGSVVIGSDIISRTREHGKKRLPPSQKVQLPPDREKLDFRNGVAAEVYSFLPLFSDPLHHWNLRHPSWDDKASESKAAILGKEDYLVLRSLYDTIDERNRHFTSRGYLATDEVVPLNQACVEAFSRAYREITWLKIASDIDSLLSDARSNVGLVASEAHMKRQEERMRLVYGPLYSAVSSMRQRENDPHRSFTVGTRFNPWTRYPEIMQKVIDVFVNFPDLVENDKVWKGWADNEDKLRTRDFWLGGKELYEWFDAIEEEFHRIDSELRARSSSS